MSNLPLLHDPDDLEQTDSWFCKIPIVGWQIGGMRQYANERRLVNQALDRGPVPESEWDQYEYSRPIRETIEKIVIDWAYPRKSQFHPHDPIELMMVLRYGDLNECGIMRDIEDKFGIRFDDGLIRWLIDKKVTFIDFIHYLESHAQQGGDL